MTRGGRSGPPDDPFEGLVLDEEFVRAAGVREGRRTGRRWLPWAVAGVVLALVVAAGGYLLSRPPVQEERAADPGPGPAVAVSGTPTPTGTTTPTPSATPDVELAGQAYSVGACYRWDQAADRTSALEVLCTQSHLFQAAGRTTVGSAGAGAYPSDEQWSQIAAARCGDLVRQLLGRPLDPHGRFVTGGIHPTEQGWVEGDRELECGVQLGGEPGTPAGSAVPAVAEDARTATQDRVLPVGTCLSAQAPDAELLQVGCEQPHTHEVTGTATLTGPADARPAEAALARTASADCTPIARRYLGRPLTGDRGLSVASTWPEADSWLAGSRLLTCYLEVATPRPGSFRG